MTEGGFWLGVVVVVVVVGVGVGVGGVGGGVCVLGRGGGGVGGRSMAPAINFFIQIYIKQFKSFIY